MAPSEPSTRPQFTHTIHKDTLCPTSAPILGAWRTFVCARGAPRCREKGVFHCAGITQLEFTGLHGVHPLTLWLGGFGDF